MRIYNNNFTFWDINYDRNINTIVAMVILIRNSDNGNMIVIGQ